LRSHALFEARERQAPPSLQRLLRHAAETVPFYAHLRRASGPYDLAEFPLVDRAALNEREAAFLSRDFGPDERFGKSTSGSTGVPLTVWRDLASLYPAAHLTWAEFFARIPSLQRPRFFDTSSLVVNDNPLLDDSVVLNPSLAFSRSRFVVLGKSEARDRAAVRRIARYRPLLLSGRPRGLLRLVELAQAERVWFKPVVVSGGDNLYDSDRAAIAAQLKTVVYNSYGSVEAGVIALECRPGGPLHVFADRAYCEVLRDDGSVAREGYGQLVNTNLENFAMCFPRYVTGDLVELSSQPCACGFSGQSLDRIDGRVSIYFYVGGRRINPAVLNKRFEAQPIKQFQLTQVSDDAFRLLLVLKHADTDAATVRAALEGTLREQLGPVEVETSVVASIGEPGKKLHRYATDIRAMAAR
jgi:phenylacetate-CoA ligase